MLPHIRAKTLEDFKEAFEPFLKKGGKFSKDDFESWTGHFLSAFDEGCASMYYLSIIYFFLIIAFLFSRKVVFLRRYIHL